jgi:hypothetical protein
VEWTREFELPGNRWSVTKYLGWFGASHPSWKYAHSTTLSAGRFRWLVRVVSRPNTRVRQTILDVICGPIAVFAAGRGFLDAA